MTEAETLALAVLERAAGPFYVAGNATQQRRILESVAREVVDPALVKIRAEIVKKRD